MKNSILLLCVALETAAVSGCHSTPRAPAAPAASVSAEAPAPFVLSLQGPAVPPSTAGELRLVAQLERPNAEAALPIDLHIVTPAGVTLQTDAAQQRLNFDAGQRTIERPLLFAVSGPLTTPIMVRASFRFGDAMGATAERIYPPPPPSTPPVEPDGPGKVTNLGQLPVGRPVTAVPSN